MTREEVKAMITMIQLDRPNFPKVQTQEAMTMLIDLWFSAFGKYDSRLMRAAVYNFLKSNQYMPTIASVQEEVDKLIDAEDDVTVEHCIKESWDAICGGKKFEDLSEASREYWGSQMAIDALSYDESTTYSVVAGQMQRRIPLIKARQKARKEIDPKLALTIRRMLDGDSGLNAIEGPEKGE